MERGQILDVLNERGMICSHFVLGRALLKVFPTIKRMGAKYAFHVNIIY